MTFLKERKLFFCLFVVTCSPEHWLYVYLSAFCIQYNDILIISIYALLPVCLSTHTHWCMTMFHVVWLFDCHTLDFAPIVGSLSLPTMFSSLSSVSFQTFLLSAAQPKFITGERAVLSRITVRSQSCSVFLWSWLERPLCFSFVLTSSSELRISSILQKRMRPNEL